MVESLPMFNATPGVFSMPMMMPMSIQQASFQQPRAAEPTCSSSGSRMSDVEERVNALDVRMRTIQRAVEIQTRILEEMKEENIFPKRYLQGSGTETTNGQRQAKPVGDPVTREEESRLGPNPWPPRQP